MTSLPRDWRTCNNAELCRATLPRHDVRETSCNDDEDEESLLLRAVPVELDPETLIEDINSPCFVYLEQRVRQVKDRERRKLTSYREPRVARHSWTGSGMEWKHFAYSFSIFDAMNADCGGLMCARSCL